MVCYGLVMVSPIIIRTQQGIDRFNDIWYGINNMKLEIELVPRTSFYKNVRSILSNEEWDKIRKECYRRAKYRCEICGGIGNTHPVECHEIWYYDDMNHIQKLTGYIALCPGCHEVKHYGRTQLMGNEGRAFNHLIKVNNIDYATAKLYISEVFNTWGIRSNYDWTIDIHIEGSS